LAGTLEPLGSPISENFEVLAEKVGTLDLKGRKKNRSGAAKKRDRKARLAQALAGTSASSQLQQGSRSGGPALEEPDISGLQTKREETSLKQGSSSSGSKLPEICNAFLCLIFEAEILYTRLLIPSPTHLYQKMAVPAPCLTLRIHLNVSTWAS
jgi:hypothetical protein